MLKCLELFYMLTMYHCQMIYWELEFLCKYMYMKVGVVSVLSMHTCETDVLEYHNTFTISCIKLGIQQKNPVIRWVMHLTSSSSYVNIYWRAMPKLDHHDLRSIFKLYIQVHFSNTMNFHIWIYLPNVQIGFYWPTFYTLVTWFKCHN